MDLTNDIVFSTIAVIVMPLLVAALLALAERIGFVWAKVNQPTIAAICGGALGAVYHVHAVYRTLNAHDPEATLGAFIVAGIVIGLGGSGFKSLVKDVRSGAISATTEDDVKRMRSSGNGRIGS